MLEQRAQLVRSYLISTLGFPFWHSGYEPACRCRGHGFDPWSGEFSHAVLGATKPVNHNYSAQVLQVLKPSTQSLCSAPREATTMRSPRTAAMKSSPGSL